MNKSTASAAASTANQKPKDNSNNDGTLRYNGHVIPDYDAQRPNEPPPSYEETVTSGAPAGIYSPPPHPPPQNYPNTNTNPNTPPRVPSNRPQSARPYHQHSGYSYQSTGQSPHGQRPATFNRMNYQQPGTQPPPPPPQAPPRPPPQPQRPVSHSTQGYPGSHIQQANYTPQPHPPFQYPRGYWCRKCSNTGVKRKNGLTCQDCYGRFARPNSNVSYLPPSGGGGLFGGLGGFFGPSTSTTTVYGGAGAGAPRVVRPGDPAIGGALCGRCRGRGLITELIFEDTCPVCRGIGRIF